MLEWQANIYMNQQKRYFIIAIIAAALILIGAGVFLLTTNRRAKNSQNTPVASSPKSVHIVGLYELADSVVYVTDKPYYSNFNFWFSPQLINTTYGNGKLIEHTQSQMQKGEGYQFLLFDQKPGDGIKSDSYIFEGNRTIIDDPRCPKQVHVDSNNKVVSVDCEDTACVKDLTFISNTCPMTKTVTPTPAMYPSGIIW